MKTAVLNQNGLSVVEILIGALLASMIVASAMEFYVTQNNAWLAQQEVSNMQQNGRVALDELISRIRLAGGGLPEGIRPLEGKNSNPDSIIIRYVTRGGILEVGDHTQKQQAVPIHVERETDFSNFYVGQVVYIWRPPSGPGEWFTITDLKDNEGSGWKEVHHKGQDLMQDPMPGDEILALNEVRYYVNAADSLHPKLIKSVAGMATDPYAEDIVDLNFVYTRKDGTTTLVPAVSDTITMVSIALRARTQNKDVLYVSNSGFRQRDYTSQVYLRNAIK